MKNFDGRLFGGRLFAGRLFRAPRRDDPFNGGPDERAEVRDARRRTTYTDDEMMQIAIAIVMSGALDH